jgi:hypothetical protein
MAPESRPGRNLCWVALVGCVLETYEKPGAEKTMAVENV